MTHEPPATPPSPDEPVTGPPAATPPPAAPPPPAPPPPAPPPPIAPPPGAVPAPYPPPQRGSNWWKILLIIAGVVALVCCIGAIGLGIWGYNKFQDVTEPVRDATNAYLDDVQNGNYGAAYDRLCASAKRQVTQQEFEQAQSVLPKITSHKITGFNLNMVDGRNTATVNVTLERELVGETSRTIELVKEGGDWKVCQVGV